MIEFWQYTASPKALFEQYQLEPGTSSMWGIFTDYSPFEFIPEPEIISVEDLEKRNIVLNQILENELKGVVFNTKEEIESIIYYLNEFQYAKDIIEEYKVKTFRSLAKLIVEKYPYFSELEIPQLLEFYRVLEEKLFNINKEMINQHQAKVFEQEMKELWQVMFWDDLEKIKRAELDYLAQEGKEKEFYNQIKQMPQVFFGGHCLAQSFNSLEKHFDIAHQKSEVYKLFSTFEEKLTGLLDQVPTSFFSLNSNVFEIAKIDWRAFKLLTDKNYLYHMFYFPLKVWEKDGNCLVMGVLREDVVSPFTIHLLAMTTQKLQNYITDFKSIIYEETGKL